MENKKVLLIGLAKTGISTIKHLNKLGANVVVEGSVDIYKDIHQIKTITSLKTSNKTKKYPLAWLVDISFSRLFCY